MRFAILSMVLFSSNVAVAAEVAVLPAVGTNLDLGEGEAIGAFLADAYITESGQSTLYPSDTRAVREGADSDLEAAKSLGVNQYITSHAVKLGEKITLRGSLYDLTGQELFTAKMTARGLDDVEQVTERVARALHGRKVIEETQTIHNVTMAESKVPNRTFVEKVMGVKTSLIYPVALGKKIEIGSMMSVGFNGRLEGERYFLEFGAGLELPTGVEHNRGSNTMDYGGLYAELGGSYYLNDNSISPYIGGGIIPRLLVSDGDGGPRMAVYGQTGLMFFRQSSSRLYADFRVAQNVLAIEDGSYYDYLEDEISENRKFYPTEFTLQVGIGW